MLETFVNIWLTVGSILGALIIFFILMFIIALVCILIIGVGIYIVEEIKEKKVNAVKKGKVKEDHFDKRI